MRWFYCYRLIGLVFKLIRDFILFWEGLLEGPKTRPPSHSVFYLSPPIPSILLFPLFSCVTRQCSLFSLPLLRTIEGDVFLELLCALSWNKCTLRVAFLGAVFPTVGRAVPLAIPRLILEIKIFLNSLN